MKWTPSLRILEGKLFWQVAIFGAPLAIGMGLQNLFNLVDAYLVGRLPKAEVASAIGAIGMCDLLAAIGTIVCYGISTATSTIIAQRVGAKDHTGVERAMWQSTLLVGIVAMVFAIFAIVFAGPLITYVMGAKGAVRTLATSYLRVLVGGSGTIFFLLHFSSIFRALGSSKTPAAMLVAGNALNVLFAAAVMFDPVSGPAFARPLASLAHSIGLSTMGLPGAAWATVVARALALIPLTVLLFSRFRFVLPPKGSRGLAGKEIRTILSVAWPASSQFVLRISAMLVTNAIVAHYFTTEFDQTASTAMGLVFRVDTLALFLALGWGSAAQTFVAQNLGANNTERAVRAGWITVLFDAFTNAAILILLSSFGIRILRLFGDDPGALAIASAYLRIMLWSYLPLGVGIVLGLAMAGAGAMKATLMIDLVVLGLIQLPLSIVAARTGSMTNLFLGVAATQAFAALFYVFWYKRRSWTRSYKPIDRIVSA